ncbi:arginine--tRNA ligase [Patescibacteria group bacterium]|nr:arginine--tRNA ligase [Patescibacteria group bacterium]
MYALTRVKKEALTSLKKAIGKKYPVSIDMLGEPPDAKMGDISFPCFALAKGMARNPAEIATEIAAKIGPSSLIARVVAVGPYVNFTVDGAAFVGAVLTDVVKDGKRYGKSTTGRGKKVLVEYANLNTHKEIHIGHVRNLALGKSLVELLRRTGYGVTPVAYINDLGNNVARALWGVMKLHPGEEPPEDALNWLGSIYAEATAALEADEERKAEVSQIQRDLENMEGEVVPLWKKSQKWSMDALKAAYAELGLELDHIYEEHDLIDETHEIVKKLLTQGIAKMSQGAAIVDLESEGLGVNLLRKSDGTLLYNAKDLALAYRKEADYAADRSLIVVDTRQSLAFKQLAETLDRMGFPREVLHIPYDFVTLPEGAMSSRKGNIVRWTDVRDAMIEKLSQATRERHADWSDRKVRDNARALAFASVQFMMLRQDPEKTLVFDMDEAMSTDGFSAPYILYTLARIESMKRKAEVIPEIVPEKLAHPVEIALAREMARYPGVIQAAAAQYKPSIVAHYAFSLAQIFARYYEEVRILDANELQFASARLALCDAVRQTLENALLSLGIPLVKEM